jgi:hypothetical protein
MKELVLKETKVTFIDKNLKIVPMLLKSKEAVAEDINDNSPFSCINYLPFYYSYFLG